MNWGAFIWHPDKGDKQMEAVAMDGQYRLPS